MTNGEEEKRRDKKHPKRLEKVVDDDIAKDIVADPFDIKTVAYHLLERPEYP